MFLKWKLPWKSSNIFFFLISFWGKTVHPVSPEAEVGSHMENAQTSKAKQSDVDQMNKVQWLICYFVTFFFIGGLFPF